MSHVCFLSLVLVPLLEHPSSWGFMRMMMGRLKCNISVRFGPNEFDEGSYERYWRRISDYICVYAFLWICCKFFVHSIITLFMRQNLGQICIMHVIFRGSYFWPWAYPGFLTGGGELWQKYLSNFINCFTQVIIKWFPPLPHNR